MPLVSPLQYVGRISISKKFAVLISFVAIILAVEVLSLWFALGMVSSLRAYVGGEGLWSKAQKESLVSLLRYSTTYQEADYEEFKKKLVVPLGDRQARTELEKDDPDRALVRQGFLAGGNHPEDIDWMIFLYQSCRSVSYVDRAISIWAEGDARVEEQLRIGEQMHALVTADPRDPSLYRRLRPLVDQALANDAELSLLEEQFSDTLSEASRAIGQTLFFAIFLVTIVLGLCVLIIALYIVRLLTRVDKAKTEFVALASHQLRSPLSVINLSLDLLKHIGSLPRKEERQVIDNMSHEVEKMSSLIQTILDASRIELGTLKMSIEAVDIIGLARDEVAALRVMAQEHHVALVEEYAVPRLTLPVDRLLYSAVIQNLLTNAIKYTRAGGSVRCRIERVNGNVVIRIADTGCGIPQKDQHRIFDKLFRSDSASKLDPHGTGLGLYIVKSIVRETGGAIMFESREGVGTTFTITYPITGMQQMSKELALR